MATSPGPCIRKVYRAATLAAWFSGFAAHGVVGVGEHLDQRCMDNRVFFNRQDVTIADFACPVPLGKARSAPIEFGQSSLLFLRKATQR